MGSVGTGMRRAQTTYSITEVHEVDGSLLVGVVALSGALDVDRAPVDGLKVGKARSVKSSILLASRT